MVTNGYKWLHGLHSESRVHSPLSGRGGPWLERARERIIKEYLNMHVAASNVETCLRCALPQEHWDNVASGDSECIFTSDNTETMYRAGVEVGSGSASTAPL